MVELLKEIKSNNKQINKMEVKVYSSKTSKKINTFPTSNSTLTFTNVS